MLLRNVQGRSGHKISGPFPLTMNFVAGSSNSQMFQLPAKKGKGVGKVSKKTVKKSGPNLTGVSTDLASDADRDAILIENGMEPGSSTSGEKIWKSWKPKEMTLRSEHATLIFWLLVGCKQPHIWTEEQTAMLWSYVEKFQLQLYHGKDNMTCL